MTVKARRVGRDHPKMHGLFLCLLFSFVASFVTSSFSFSFVTCLLFLYLFCSSISFSFSFVTFPFFCVSLFFGSGTLG